MRSNKTGGAENVKMKTREYLAGYAMVLPAVLLFIAFALYPAIRTFTLPFYDWDMLSAPVFVKFENFTRLFADERLPLILRNTALVAVVPVVFKLLFGFLAAYLVFRLRGKAATVFMESAIFFPIIIPMSIVSMVFTMLLGTDVGAINGILYALGLPKIPWLTSAKWAIWSVMMVDVWKGIGFFFIIYLVALRNVPKSYIEAAEIDGANQFYSTVKILVPCVSATSLFLLVNALITGLQLFEPIYLLTRGGPGDATATVSYYIWSIAFQERDMGYGALLALVLFCFMMLITLLQFLLSKFWVHYDD